MKQFNDTSVTAACVAPVAGLVCTLNAEWRDQHRELGRDLGRELACAIWAGFEPAGIRRPRVAQPDFVNVRAAVYCHLVILFNINNTIGIRKGFALAD